MGAAAVSCGWLQLRPLLQGLRLARGGCHPAGPGQHAHVHCARQQGITATITLATQVPLPPFTPPDRCVDYAALIAGVTSTVSSALTNPILMWGQAIPLSGTATSYYAAATRYGYGTAVVYGHEAVMGVTTHGLGTLNRNVLLWASGAGTSSAGSPAKLVCYADSWAKGTATSMMANVGARLVACL